MNIIQNCVVSNTNLVVYLRWLAISYSPIVFKVGSSGHEGFYPTDPWPLLGIPAYMTVMDMA